MEGKAMQWQSPRLCRVYIHTDLCLPRQSTSPYILYDGIRTSLPSPWSTVRSSPAGAMYHRLKAKQRKGGSSKNKTPQKPKKNFRILHEHCLLACCYAINQPMFPSLSPLPPPILSRLQADDPTLSSTHPASFPLRHHTYNYCNPLQSTAPPFLLPITPPIHLHTRKENGDREIHAEQTPTLHATPHREQKKSKERKNSLILTIPFASSVRRRLSLQKLAARPSTCYDILLARSLACLPAPLSPLRSASKDDLCIFR